MLGLDHQPTSVSNSSSSIFFCYTNKKWEFCGHIKPERPLPEFAWVETFFTHLRDIQVKSWYGSKGGPQGSTIFYCAMVFKGTVRMDIVRSTEERRRGQVWNYLWRGTSRSVLLLFRLAGRARRGDCPTRSRSRKARARETDRSSGS